MVVWDTDQRDSLPKRLCWHSLVWKIHMFIHWKQAVLQCWKWDMEVATYFGLLLAEKGKTKSTQIPFFGTKRYKCNIATPNLVWRPNSFFDMTVRKSHDPRNAVPPTLWSTNETLSPENRVSSLQSFQASIWRHNSTVYASASWATLHLRSSVIGPEVQWHFFISSMTARPTGNKSSWGKLMPRGIHHFAMFF